MQLNHAGRTIDNPSADDIVQSIPAGAPPEDWDIELVDDKGLSIEAEVDRHGTFALAYVEDGRIHDADRPVDRRELIEILELFRRGDAAWRVKRRFTLWVSKPATTPRFDRSSLGVWLLALIVPAILGILWLMPGILNALGVKMPGLSSLGLRLPAAFDSVFAQMFLAFGVLVALLFVAATLVKLREVRCARHWPRTSGRILSAGLGTEHVTPAGGATKVRNVAKIEYEFAVAGKAYRGSRITLGENTRGADADALLRRYPTGAVVDVFYDPKDPTNCVVERGLPQGFASGCLVLAALGVAAIIAVMWFATRAPDLVQNALPRSQPLVLFIALGVGMLLAIAFLADRRKRADAGAWSRASGTVTTSGTQTVSSNSDGGTSRMHAPAVEYAYRVGGQEYRSRQIRLGVSSAGSLAWAQRIAARYPIGASVVVHYDPRNPSDAALVVASRAPWILAALALAAFAVAIGASGIF